MALKRMKEFSVKGNDTLFECPNTMDGHFYKLVFDCSSSMETHEDTMRTCLKNYKQQISDSDEASRIFVSRADFTSRYSEMKYLNIKNMSTDYNANGWTNLYDAIVYSVNNAIETKQALIEQGYTPTMFNIYFSDGEHCIGWDNEPSYYDIKDVKNAVKKALENDITMIFIDFGGENGSIPKELGFTSVYDPENSSEALIQIMDDITQTTISQSKMDVVNVDNWLNK